MKTNFKSYSTIDVGTNNIGINYLRYVIDNETGRYIIVDIESKPNYVILKLYSPKDELLSSCEFNINSVVSCELDLINENIILTNSNSQKIICDISELIDLIAVAYDHSQLVTGNPHNVIAEEISYDNTTSGLTATDVNSAIDEIDIVLDNLTFETSVTVKTTDWEVDEDEEPIAAYKAEIAVEGILATDSPIIAFDLTGIADTAWATSRTEFAKIGLAETTDDEITFYASAIPTEDIAIIVKVVR